MAKDSQTRMMASGASPGISAPPGTAVPVPPPAVPRAAPAPGAGPEPTPAESDWPEGRLEEAIFRPTLKANGELVVEVLPPTLYNLTHPKEEDDVSQGNRHYRTLDPLDDILRRKLEKTRPGVGVFSELMIYWRDPAMESSCPDICVVLGLGRPPEEIGNSFYVAKEGVGPCLVFEIVSSTYKSTREKDYDFNPVHYAKAGVKELVLVEPVTRGSPEIRRLVGLRLGAADEYEEIEPDDSGRILLDTVGFQIHVEQAAVVVEDAETGERFLTSSEEEDARKEAQRCAEDAQRRAEEAQQRAEDEARTRKEAQRRAERSRAEALLTVLSARGFDLSGEVRGRILATTEAQTLERWLCRAATASSLDEVLDESS